MRVCCEFSPVVPAFSGLPCIWLPSLTVSRCRYRQRQLNVKPCWWFMAYLCLHLLLSFSYGTTQCFDCMLSERERVSTFYYGFVQIILWTMEFEPVLFSVKFKSDLFSQLFYSVLSEPTCSVLFKVYCNNLQCQSIVSLFKYDSNSGNKLQKRSLLHR